MALTFAATTLFMPRLLPTSPYKNKSTCCGGTKNGSHTGQNGFPKEKVSTASKEDDGKTARSDAAAKKMTQPLNLESSKFNGVYDTFSGRLGPTGLVFQQNFSIRSYELGPDGKASIGCLIKRLQETSVQHCRSLGLFAGGFGSTPEMSKRGLVWVLRKLHLLVENYPSWADVIQIDTSTGASGNNCLFRDWIFRDYRTGEVLIRATGLYVLMNTKTRKLSKVIPEIRDEIKPVLVDSDSLLDINNSKLQRLDIDAKYFVQTGLAPSWSDLDVNQHVSHAKYIDWIFESIPVSILESQELSSMTLEFRRECRRDNVLHSLTAVARDGIGDSTHTEGVEFDHSLRLEAGSEILRAKTTWRPKVDGVFSTLKIPATNGRA